MNSEEKDQYIQELLTCLRAAGTMSTRLRVLDTCPWEELSLTMEAVMNAKDEYDNLISGMLDKYLYEK